MIFTMVDWLKLSAKFKDSEIEWRVQSAGLGKDTNIPYAKIIPYVTARSVMDRLDEVVGPGKWKDEYVHIPSGVMCKLSINIANDTQDNWLTKEDGSEETEIEGFKGGISKALVRAAVKFGIGRYLYDTPTTFAQFVDKNTHGAIYAKIEGKSFYWIPPKPKEEPKKAEEPEIPEVKPDNDLKCSHCGGLMHFYATKGVYACGNKMFVKDEHTRLKPSEVEAFRKNMKPEINEDIPKCSLCHIDLIMAPKRTHFYCKNYQDKSKGPHTTVRIGVVNGKTEENRGPEATGSA